VRLSLLLVTVLMVLTLPLRQAHADPLFAIGTLDQPLVAHVAALALAFMVPRTLEAFAPEQLGLWGLRGLATIDPRLLPELRGRQLRLSLFARPAPRLLLARALPEATAAGGADMAAWGDTLAALIGAAWDASPALRRVGANGLLDALFNGICTHLDAYSRYEGPGEAAELDPWRAGVGLDVAASRRGYVIDGVSADGPAAGSGIRPGDLLLAIDGQPVAALAPDAVATRLAGPEGSSIVLRLRGRAGRGGRPVDRDLTLSRAVPTPDTVAARWEDDLLVLRISAFAPGTGVRLAQALAALDTDPRRGRAARGVVIDLRGNRGGLLREAASAARTLIPRGLLARTVGRDPEANQRLLAVGEDLAEGRPVLVLVDGDSASAAEVLAAALADQHRGVVIGSATLGKGLVQTVGDLPNGGRIVLTWSRVLAPNGWPIQGLGVLPQVCTSLGREVTAAQLGALDRGGQPMAEVLARHRAERPGLSAVEMLAVREACPAALDAGDGRHDAGLAVAAFLATHPVAYAAALLGPAD
jgi:carboxyl-terminal processing protease